MDDAVTGGDQSKYLEKQNSTKAEDVFSRTATIAQSIRRNTSNIGLNLQLKSQAAKEPPLIEDTKVVVKFSPLWRQTITASSSILCTLTAGLTSGYSAVLLPQLEQPDSIIQINDETKSWIASMAALPMAFGCLLAGWMMEKFGRKLSHQLICVPFIIGWLLIAFADNLAVMLLGRFFTGICVGLLGPLGPVYIAETSDPKYRGFFLAAVSLAIAVGLLVAHVIGAYLHWKLTALICAVFPVVAFLLLLCVPESPMWLISKDRSEDGTKAFFWLRGYGDSAKEELKAIVTKHDEEKDQNENMTLSEKFAQLKSPEVYKPLLIMIIFFISSQFSGVNAVAFYSVDIMRKTLGENFDRYLAMFIIDTVRVVMSVAACILVRHFGRRTLSFISGIVTCTSLFGLASFLYFTRDNPQPHLLWLPLVLLITYISAISIGIVPLPWIMCGEIFPTKARGLLSGISSAVTFASFFVVVKTVPAMSSTLGDDGMYLTYGTICFVGTIIMFFILPETKGKSLQEIEDQFKTKKNDVA